MPPEPFRVVVVPQWRGEAPPQAVGGWWALLDDALVVIAPEEADGLAHRLAATADRSVGVSARPPIRLWVRGSGRRPKRPRPVTGSVPRWCTTTSWP